MRRNVSRPELSGNDRSRRTTSIPPAARRSSPASRRATDSRTKGKSWPAWRSSRMSRTSPGLSSISRILNALLSIVLRGRHGDDSEEEVLERADGLDHLEEIGRLGDVGAGLQVVSPVDVLWSIRTGQNDHRNALELFIGLDLGEHL